MWPQTSQEAEGPFNDMSVRCLGHQSLVGETFDFHGSCVETDKDGDNIFTTFDTKAHYFMDGTGKYKGITGTIPYTVTDLHDAAGGRDRIVNHKATWEIKSAAAEARIAPNSGRRCWMPA